MRKVTIIVLTLALSACATTNHYSQAVNSWEGGNLKTLKKVWGKPDAVEKAANGNKTYVYKTEKLPSYSTQGPTGAPAAGINVNAAGRPVMAPMSRSNDSAIPQIKLSCSAQFTANTSGKIIATETQGNHCYGSKQFAAKHQNPNAAQ